MDVKNLNLGKLSPNWKGHFNGKNMFSNNSYLIQNLDSNAQIISIKGQYLKHYKATIPEINMEN
jgi:hypothetical protein